MYLPSLGTMVCNNGHFTLIFANAEIFQEGNLISSCILECIVYWTRTRTFCNVSYFIWNQKARDCNLQWSTWIFIKFLSHTLPCWNLMLLMGGDLMNSIIFCTVLAFRYSSSYLPYLTQFHWKGANSSGESWNGSDAYLRILFKNFRCTKMCYIILT